VRRRHWVGDCRPPRPRRTRWQHRCREQPVVRRRGLRHRCACAVGALPCGSMRP
jgi:hypothetical protein